MMFLRILSGATLLIAMPLVTNAQELPPAGTSPDMAEPLPASGPGAGTNTAAQSIDSSSANSEWPLPGPRQVEGVPAVEPTPESDDPRGVGELPAAQGPSPYGQPVTPVQPGTSDGTAYSTAAEADADRSGPLTLGDVLRSSARTAPQIIEALARIRQAQGRALTAEGAFDLVFAAEGRSRVLGYYSGTYVEGRATRPLEENGGYTYGNYRVSRGAFPIYEDEEFTNQLGEVKIGALYALLRDRLIDERRARRTIAAQGIDVARFEAEAAVIGVQARAVQAYQAWVAAGLRLRVYQNLLELAVSRRGAIARLVELGARAEILLVENDQNLLRRRALVIEAEQRFAAAANALSLFYRNTSGEPITPDAARLPEDSAALAALQISPSFSVENRPELQTLLAQTDQSLVRLALAKNDLVPRIDLFGEVGKDLGPRGLGGPSRSPLEVVVGFRFSMPLENRGARGRVLEALSEIDALDWRQRFLRDQIANQVENISIALEGTERLVDVARRERELAERLAAAERRRFQLGAVDFFVVNQREEIAADAAIRLIDAETRFAGAQADLSAAVADRGALGLED